MTTYDQLMKRAEERLRADDVVQGMHLFAEAHKQAPDRKEPLVELALLFIEHDDTPGAIGFLEKALQLDGTDAFIRLNLALAFYETKQEEKAVEHLREAILLIQYIVASTRIDRMFGKATEEEIKRADDLEQTGIQAIDLLREIAGIEDPQAENEEGGARIFRLAS